MNTFPSIRTPATIGRRKRKAQNRSEFEAGYVQSVARHTKSRFRFSLTWNRMETTDLVILETFFDNNQGDLFYWVHPITSIAYTVRFAMDEIEADFVTGSITGWSVTIELEEA